MFYQGSYLPSSKTTTTVEHGKRHLCDPEMKERYRWAISFCFMVKHPWNPMKPHETPYLSWWNPNWWHLNRAFTWRPGSGWALLEDLVRPGWAHLARRVEDFTHFHRENGVLSMVTAENTKSWMVYHENTWKYPLKWTVKMRCLSPKRYNIMIWGSLDLDGNRQRRIDQTIRFLGIQSANATH